MFLEERHPSSNLQARGVDVVVVAKTGTRLWLALAGKGGGGGGDGEQGPYGPPLTRIELEGGGPWQAGQSPKNRLQLGR